MCLHEMKMRRSFVVVIACVLALLPVATTTTTAAQQGQQQRATLATLGVAFAWAHQGAAGAEPQATGLPPLQAHVRSVVARLPSTLALHLYWPLNRTHCDTAAPMRSLIVSLQQTLVTYADFAMRTWLQMLLRVTLLASDERPSEQEQVEAAWEAVAVTQHVALLVHRHTEVTVCPNACTRNDATHANERPWEHRRHHSAGLVADCVCTRMRAWSRAWNDTAAAAAGWMMGLTRGGTITAPTWANMWAGFGSDWLRTHVWPLVRHSIGAVEACGALAGLHDAAFVSLFPAHAWHLDLTDPITRIAWSNDTASAALTALPVVFPQPTACASTRAASNTAPHTRVRDPECPPRYHLDADGLCRLCLPGTWCPGDNVQHLCQNMLPSNASWIAFGWTTPQCPMDCHPSTLYLVTEPVPQCAPIPLGYYLDDESASPYALRPCTLAPEAAALGANASSPLLQWLSSGPRCNTCGWRFRAKASTPVPPALHSLRQPNWSLSFWWQSAEGDTSGARVRVIPLLAVAGSWQLSAVFSAGAPGHAFLQLEWATASSSAAADDGDDGDATRILPVARSDAFAWSSKHAMHMAVVAHAGSRRLQFRVNGTLCGTAVYWNATRGTDGNATLHVAPQAVPSFAFRMESLWVSSGADVAPLLTSGGDEAGVWKPPYWPHLWRTTRPSLSLFNASASDNVVAMPSQLECIPGAIDQPQGGSDEAQDHCNCLPGYHPTWTVTAPVPITSGSNPAVIQVCFDHDPAPGLQAFVRLPNTTIALEPLTTTAAVGCTSWTLAWSSLGERPFSLALRWPSLSSHTAATRVTLPGPSGDACFHSTVKASGAHVLHHLTPCATDVRRHSAPSAVTASAACTPCASATSDGRVCGCGVAAYECGAANGVDTGCCSTVHVLPAPSATLPSGVYAEGTVVTFHTSCWDRATDAANAKANGTAPSSCIILLHITYNMADNDATSNTVAPFLDNRELYPGNASLSLSHSARVTAVTTTTAGDARGVDAVFTYVVRPQLPRVHMAVNATSVATSTLPHATLPTTVFLGTPTQWPQGATLWARSLPAFSASSSSPLSSLSQDHTWREVPNTARPHLVVTHEGQRMQVVARAPYRLPSDPLTIVCTATACYSNQGYEDAGTPPPQPSVAHPLPQRRHGFCSSGSMCATAIALTVTVIGLALAAVVVVMLHDYARSTQRATESIPMESRTASGTSPS